MKSKALFIPILIFLLSNSIPCLSQSNSDIHVRQNCCPTQDKSIFYHVSNQVEEDKVFTLSFGLTEMLGNLLSNKVISVGLLDENEIERADRKSVV